jgi:hypothetical protein
VEEDRPEFLPPQPPGPEPELGHAPAPPAPPEQAATQPLTPPPPGYQAQQPPAYPPQAPPGSPPQPGWQQPPPGWGYPQPAQPDNGPAVAGFVLSLVGGGLLFLSAGLSSVISLTCSIFGMFYSRKGKKRVAAGETTKNAGLAQAGWVIGIISLVLSVLATLIWMLVLIAALTDDEFRDELEREFDDSDSIRAVVRIAAAGVRVLLG